MVVYVLEQLDRNHIEDKRLGIYKDREEAEQKKGFITAHTRSAMCIKTYPVMDYKEEKCNAILYELQCKEAHTSFIIGFYANVENAKKAMQYYKKKLCCSREFSAFWIVQHLL